jgi:hypothetical protein
MSATGSVNLIVCFSLNRSFAPRYFDNQRRTCSGLFPSLLTFVILRRLLLSPKDLSALREHSRVLCENAKSRVKRTSLPGRLRNPWNLPAQRELAEAQAADAELAQKRARTPAKLAAVVLACGELGFLYFALMQPNVVFDSFCCRSHLSS